MNRGARVGGGRCYFVIAPLLLLLPPFVRSLARPSARNKAWEENGESFQASARPTATARRPNIPNVQHAAASSQLEVPRRRPPDHRQQDRRIWIEVHPQHEVKMRNEQSKGKRAVRCQDHESEEMEMNS